jgi:ribosomal-protein-alanine N-acetyltransferase
VEITVEAMCVADLEAVLEIENASFPTPWSRNAFLQELLENDRAIYLVARDELERIAGYIGMWVVFDEGHITNLATHPAFRRSGVGRALLTAMLQSGRERGVRYMTLEVRRSNLAAQQLYQKAGFAQMGVRRQYYLDNKEDALIMWKGPV